MSLFLHHIYFVLLESSLHWPWSSYSTGPLVSLKCCSRMVGWFRFGLLQWQPLKYGRIRNFIQTYESIQSSMSPGKLYICFHSVTFESHQVFYVVVAPCFSLFWVNITAFVFYVLLCLLYWLVVLNNLVFCSTLFFAFFFYTLHIS